jgi:Sec-independent protein secretion pathway component TatC
MVPMLILFEFSILVAKVVGRPEGARRKRRRRRRRKRREKDKAQETTEQEPSDESRE